MMSKRGVWVCVALGVLALLVMGGMDAAQWAAGAVDWLLHAPAAIWVGMGMVGMVMLGLGEIK
jgi:hypothetical protein